MPTLLEATASQELGAITATDAPGTSGLRGSAIDAGDSGEGGTGQGAEGGAAEGETDAGPSNAGTDNASLLADVSTDSASLTAAYPYDFDLCLLPR